MTRALLAAAVFAASCNTPAPPAPTPAPTPVHVDAGPATTCDAYTDGLGSVLTCIGFATGKPPGTVLPLVIAKCAASGVAVTRVYVASLDTSHECLGGAK